MPTNSRSQPCPPLSLLCLHALIPSTDQLHRVFDSIRLNPNPNVFPSDPDISSVDPRFWATIIQVYNNIPPRFVTYPICLFHKYLPLLQQIPPTPQCSLITLLELPACPQLTDESIVHLRQLHSLTALDASDTNISYYAIKRLTQALVMDSSTRLNWRGPWPLRILRLRNCKNIDNLIFPLLSKFVLLCVLDIRGTQCIPRSSSFASDWRTGTNIKFFFPSTLSQAVDALPQSTSSNLCSSLNIFRLLIRSMDPHNDQSIMTPQPTAQPDPGAVPANLFYGQSPASRDRKNYVAEVYYERKDNIEHSAFSDGISRIKMSQQLMLSRKPPPWSALEEALQNYDKTVKSVNKKSKQEVIPIKASGTRQGGLAKLQEIALRRKV